MRGASCVARATTLTLNDHRPPSAEYGQRLMAFSSSVFTVLEIGVIGPTCHLDIGTAQYGRGGSVLLLSRAGARAQRDNNLIHR